MTDKQRWLLADLDKWERAQMERIGRYGPSPLPPTRALTAARRAVKKAEAQVKLLEKAHRAPWEKLKALVEHHRQSVKRMILFETTEVALRALKSLPSKVSR